MLLETVSTKRPRAHDAMVSAVADACEPSPAARLKLLSDNLVFTLECEEERLQTSGRDFLRVFAELEARHVKGVIWTRRMARAERGSTC